MGKWSHLVGEVKDFPADPTREGALNARLDELKALPIAKLAELYNAADDEKKAIAKREKDINFELEAVTKAIDRRCKEDSLESVVTNGYRYTPKPEPYAQVADKPVFLEWALREMRDNLQLHHSTLNAIVKQALETGAELPPGTDVFLKRGIHRTKQKA